MSHDEANHEQPDESTTDRTGRRITRRNVLETTAVGAVTAALGTTAIGSAAAGIPTPWLERDGNLVRDSSGNKVILRGVNVPDAKRMNTKEFRPDADETIRRATNEDEGWYSRVVRLPVQPVDVGGHGTGSIPPVPGFTRSQLESYVRNHLRPAVDACAEQNVYCIVDYHRHRGQDDEHAYDSQGVHDELTMFWETVASEFAGDSNVLFEVYNEPIHPFQGHYDPNVDVDPTDDEAIETWNAWKAAAQPWVDTIRENAPQNLVLIGSPRWSQWTYQAPNNEFEGDNLAYTGHVYAHENLRPLSTYFGEPAREVPVFLTEFGWGTNGADYLTGTAAEEGEEFATFFADNDVHWQVWCFDSKWSPAMLDHDWSVLEYGQFWKEYLAEYSDADLPAGEVATDTPTQTATATATPDDTPTDTPTDTPAGDALVINDYDGSPAWSSNQNDLGQWCGAGSFVNDGGEVVDGVLQLQYDGGGWYQEQINRAVDEYETLVIRVSGANGGEESEVQFDMGGVSTPLSDVTSDSIGTSTGDVAVDLAAAGVDRGSSSLSLRLNFWQAASGFLRIESLWLE